MLRSLARRSGLAATLVTSLAVGSVASAAVTVAAGPYYNPTTKSRYYRITGGDWNQLRAFALSMGGDLVSLDDAAENTWVRNTVVGNNKPFIGLNDAAVEGTLVWADGSSSGFFAWRAGEPANSASKDYVRYDGQAAGTWEIVTAGLSPDAIVEIKPLNGQQAPVRVPAEQPTVQAGLLAANQIDASEVVLSAGTHALTTPVSVAGRKLRGAGIGLTILQLPATTSASISMFGGVMQDMTIVKRTSAPSTEIAEGTNRIRRVEFATAPGTSAGSLLVVSEADQPTVIESCVFHSSALAIDVSPIRAGNGSLTVANSIFRDLGAVSFGNQFLPRMTFSNCVITRCGSPTANLFKSAVTTSVSNSIFWSNFGGIGSATVRYSVAPTTLGPTNLDTDPKFVNAPANDFRLQPDSPCIDRGSVVDFVAALPDSLADFAGNPRAIDAPGVPNYTSSETPIDLGVFEFTRTSCPGDLNFDGVVDDIDFQIFVVWYNQVICP